MNACFQKKNTNPEMTKTAKASILQFHMSSSLLDWIFFNFQHNNNLVYDTMGHSERFLFTGAIWGETLSETAPPTV